MKPTTPMSAQERRHAWYNNNVELGLIQYLRDIDIPLKNSLDRYFAALEYLLGQETTASKLLGLIQGANKGEKQWRTVLHSSSLSPTSDQWSSAVLLDHAGLYGLFGVTPDDVDYAKRRSWVDLLPKRLDEWQRNVHLDQDAKNIEAVIKLALSRHTMDSGMSLESITSMEEPVEGHVDIGSLSIFGGVTEGRIRNILSSGESCLEKVERGVTASSAAEWLKGRKEYYPSIWKEPDNVTPTTPSLNFIDEVIFIPVASDGSHFHPRLTRSGKFTIGAKGEETQYDSYEKALAELQKMATPRWRRPNSAGNWGIVSGRDWKRVERSKLPAT